MTRSAFPLIAVLVGVLWAATGTVAGAAAEALSCRTEAHGKGGVRAVCELRPHQASKRLRFKARFIGSHDDTELAITSTSVDGAPVACGGDSKTASRYEDGDVTLHCSVSAAGGRSAARLTVLIAVHHAQLDGVELVAE
jgi:hypothetical protein